MADSSAIVVERLRAIDNGPIYKILVLKRLQRGDHLRFDPETGQLEKYTA